MVDYIADQAGEIGKAMREIQKAEGRNPEPIEQALSAGTTAVMTLWCRGCTKSFLRDITATGEQEGIFIRGGLLRCRICNELLNVPADQYKVKTRSTPQR